MRTRICSGKCGKRLPEDAIHFAYRSSRTGQLRRNCKACHNEEAAQKYSVNTDAKDKARLYQTKYRHRNRSLIISYLSEHPCVDCGETDGIVLEFDHVYGEKIRNVSWMVRQHRTVSKIMDEIAKCEVVCANCHRRRTAKRAGWDIPYLEFKATMLKEKVS